MTAALPSSVLVTGASGNIGRKIVEALAPAPWCNRIVALDLAASSDKFSPAAATKLQAVSGDLRHAVGDWTSAFIGIDACVHLAAQNPDVDASWSEAANSFDMTVNVGMACLRHGVGRLVFASSNHVMGGYKDAPLSDGLKPGQLTTDLAPAPGTKWHDGTNFQDSTPYATAKLMGERFTSDIARQSEGRLTGISVRIGWAQPGENLPRTISHAGSVIGGIPEAKDDAARRDLRWFRNMWLSNADLTALFLAAVSADAAPWPEPAIIVNGMSANRGMDWDLSSAIRWLNYRPNDDLYAQHEL
ncbi:NAD-dependent epimerase/dehydratase family protein [Microvirga zambiensis]|uniref:NAD-dependent epimerase/dehydratase family protein n=1 Tax=Microvirga zambiensis TaxID=1402137 RepID=UPI00191D99D7|nr:NAD(P)-dependent oxidoreductase [Microvirga zambiensis]